MAVVFAMPLSETMEDEEEDRDKLWSLYCLLTAWYNFKAGIVFDNFGSVSAESKPKPSSKQALSSCKSSSETLLVSRRVLLRLTWSCFRLRHASSRSISGDHVACFKSREGGRELDGFDIRMMMIRFCNINCVFMSSW